MISSLLLLSLIPFAASIADQPAPPTDIPPEELRFDPDKFHEGLKNRGLTEILELHLREFPPSNASHALLMMREVKIAEFNDATKPRDQRIAAISEANQLLERAMAGLTDDMRRFEWRYTLAHSLIYQEGEPHATSILYRGGSSDHRKQLLSLTTRGLALVDNLDEEVEKEFTRVDNLPSHEFEKLEQAGYVDLLDRLGPRADYLKLWGTFFNAIARESADPQYASRLHEVIKLLEPRMSFVNDAQNPSASQAEFNLLLGMVQRRLRDHAAARKYLESAARIDEKLAETAKKSPTWVYTLAAIELARNDAEESRFEEALNEIKLHRLKMTSRAGDFDWQLSLALTERYVHRLWTAQLSQSTKRTEERNQRDTAWQVVLNVIGDKPERKDDLYAILFDLIEPEAAPAQLDPLEQCVVLARSLFEADKNPEQAQTHLARAGNAGEFFLKSVGDTTKPLLPEVLFNLGVVYYRLDRLVEASASFFQISRNYRTLPYAVQAASLAVQLAHDAMHDESIAPADREKARQLYMDALAALQTNYPVSEAAKRWQFHYGVALEDKGQFEAAIAAFGTLGEGHEFRVESLFHRAHCIARLAAQLAPKHTTDFVRIHQLADDFTLAAESFAKLVKDQPDSSDSSRSPALVGMRARLTIDAAELRLLPQFNKPQEALDKLAGFETVFASEPSLVPDVWRVRLRAYDALGRLDEASKAIPIFVAADPKNAGPVLQTLYVSLVEQLDREQTPADVKANQTKVDLALLIAEQIALWADRTDSGVSAEQKIAVKTQWAEARLRAGQFDKARELFESVLATLETKGDKKLISPKQEWGLAETQYQLKDYASALARFNQLATSLPPTDPLRWKSLLRDLQCRTILKHPADGILRVIRQQRTLYPDMGGPTLAPQFDQLERDNERR